MGVLAQAKNGDEQFWKQKFHVVDEKAQPALKVSWFFFFFPFVPNMFPSNFSSGSQCVLYVFPNAIHNSTSL